MTTTAGVAFHNGIVYLQDGKKNTMFYFTYPYGILEPAMTKIVYHMDCRGSFLLKILKISVLAFCVIAEGLLLIPMTILYNVAAFTYNKLKGEKIFLHLTKHPLENSKSYYMTEGLIVVRYTGDLCPFGVAKSEPPSSLIDRIKRLTNDVRLDMRDLYVPFQGRSLRTAMEIAHQFYFGSPVMENLNNHLSFIAKRKKNFS
jgi:hypothetical protein